jgi:glycosyltransferase involved in cell wall biosynthesis
MEEHGDGGDNLRVSNCIQPSRYVSGAAPASFILPARGSTRMRIALIASPFISVPPKKYGGTELFISQLAEGLTRLGIDVVVYANGESTVKAQLRWLYPKDEWPIDNEMYSNLKDLDHTSWSVSDCWHDADVIHLNNAPCLVFSRLRGPRCVYTLHHPHVPSLSAFYAGFPNVEFVSISNFQKENEPLERIRTIHHGIDLGPYHLQTKKAAYLSFLGRIAPVKGIHNAIEIARRSGIPLKIAGEVQPMDREYFDSCVRPHVDGKFIEYVGEADLALKNELLGNSMAMLFPIEWDEPFGLVMVEAMATGTPVIAFPGGSVAEIVRDGISGFVCCGIEDAVARLREVPAIKPAAVRAYVQQYFSAERMVQDYLALYREMCDEAAVVEDSNLGSQAAA